MRTTMLAMLVLVIGATRALAQPGTTDSQPPPAYAYQPQITADEQDLLASGEITDNQQALGGLAALFVGFGLGQGVEGRWHETGWIFTLGESASTVAIVWGVGEGLSDCFSADGTDQACKRNRGVPLIVAGLIGLGGFRIGEILDAVIMPSHHNAELRVLRARLGYPQPVYAHLAPFVAPVQGGGSVAGLTLQF
jgi:hypothetical protein